MIKKLKWTSPSKSKAFCDVKGEEMQAPTFGGFYVYFKAVLQPSPKISC